MIKCPREKCIGGIMKNRTRCLAVLVAGGLLLSDVVMTTPALFAAAAVAPSDTPLPPIDPGRSEHAPPLPPAAVVHAARLPDPVTTVVTTGVDKAATVVGLPVSMRTTAMAVASGDKTPVPVDVAVDSLDRAAAESLGADGFAFGVSLAKPIDGNALVEVTVDYSAFRSLYGADWAQRLQVGNWPCGAGTARTSPKSCGNPTPVAGVKNDLERGVLMFEIPIGSFMS